MIATAMTELFQLLSQRTTRVVDLTQVINEHTLTLAATLHCLWCRGL